MSASLLASGCAFTVDGNYIKAPDSGSGGVHEDADAPEPDSDTPEPAGNTEDGGAQGAEPDASPAPGVDGAPPECEEVPCPRACSEDSACETSEYCSKQRGTCAPRCDEALGCAGPRAASLVSMFSDGHTASWSTENTATDVAGNPLDNGAIWSWDLTAEPVKIASDFYSAELLFEADGELYFLRMRLADSKSFRDLYRVKVDTPGAIELVSEDVSMAWSTGDYIYWSTQWWADEEKVELWRLARGAGEDRVRLATSTHRGWIGGDDEFVYHAERRPTPDFDTEFLVADQLSDLSVQRDVRQGFHWSDTKLTVNGDTLYFTEPSFQDEVLRLDMTDDEVQRLAPHTFFSLSYFAQTSWVYWGIYAERNDGTREVIYGRTHGDLMAEGAELLRRETADIRLRPPAFTVVGKQLAYWSADEERVFTLSLPALPCSANVACPAAQSCTAALLCE